MSLSWVVKHFDNIKYVLSGEPDTESPAAMSGLLPYFVPKLHNKLQSKQFLLVLRNNIAILCFWRFDTASTITVIQSHKKRYLKVFFR
jgi:hypothetical protein